MDITLISWSFYSVKQVIIEIVPYASVTIGELDIYVLTDDPTLPNPCYCLTFSCYG